MDGSSFDALTRSFALSRRSALKGALTGAAALAGVRSQADAARRGYSGPNVTGCTIGGVQYAAGAVDPSQSCRVCAPLSNKTGWTVLSDGTSCGSGLCCAGGICDACGCVIGGQQVAAGATNPSNTCQSCQPEIDAGNWSTKSNDETCDANGFAYCCEGTCCGHPGLCCHNGSCFPCFCVIDGIRYEDGTLNPLNECQWCAAPLSTTSWANRAIGQPCSDGNVCCVGVCQDGCP